MYNHFKKSSVITAKAKLKWQKQRDEVKQDVVDQLAASALGKTTCSKRRKPSTRWSVRKDKTEHRWVSGSEMQSKSLSDCQGKLHRKQHATEETKRVKEIAKHRWEECEKQFGDRKQVFERGRQKQTQLAEQVDTLQRENRRIKGRCKTTGDRQSRRRSIECCRGIQGSIGRVSKADAKG